MKKLIFASTIVFFAVVSGCNSAESGDPKTVLTAFFDAVSKQDFEGAKKYVTNDSKMMLAGMEIGKTYGGEQMQKELQRFDRSAIVFGEATIKGDSAFVPVTYTKEQNATVNFPLKKEGGNWKVDFSMGSMMNMGMDRMKNHMGRDSVDMNVAIDQLKNINLDSLKDNVNKIKDVIGSDSLKNAIDKSLRLMDSLKHLH
jgi:hypothetical protein